ncbi:unnamed protein product [Allacma fusca]|uniref:Periodic tryptophan protein 2 n=1 Tax=Allacma fusca TaxID=39272 RepID=A0A8J2JRH7_9HEXA|nr:unnamed protein product [Allacma fusca]
MRNYKFAKLLGTVYKKGNIVLTADGFTLISPVGNRISVYDLKNHVTTTLPVEVSHNFTSIALSPNECVLLAATEIGEVHVISLVSKTVIHCLKVGRNIGCMKFSPDGTLFAVAKEGTVFVYNAPTPKKCFNPFLMERVFNTGNKAANISSIAWSYDSRLIAFGSSDMMIRVHSLTKFSNFKNVAFTGHSDGIVSCSFSLDDYTFYSLSRNGQLCVWECTLEPDEFLPAETTGRKAAEGLQEDEMEESLEKRQKTSSEDTEVESTNEAQTYARFKKLTRHYYSDLFKKGEKRPNVVCADFNVRDTVTLVAGFSDGSFFIHLLPEFELMTSLNIENQELSTITFNNHSFYIAIGCSKLGQLLVWEWPSETYAMKQQGHFNMMNVVDFSSDGRYLVTGGEDGKVKVWDSFTSFCFVTFTEHTSSVTGVAFTQNGKAVVSSSLDGTVRAFDLTRYRNFRTFTSPRPVQFSCVSVDSSREFVASGGQDVFDIFVWSMNTGRLLEILSGHEGPVTAVSFTPSLGSTLLASASWDKSLRLWEAIESSSSKEIVSLSCEATCLAFRPDGKQVAVGTLDSHITFFETGTCTQSGSIEGRNHLGAGRSDTDLITAKKNLESKAFTTICYTADGTGLLAAGQSKNICYYDSARKVLVAKYEITQNKSFDAVDEFVNHRKMTEFGNSDLIEDRDDNFADKMRLPGVKKGDMAARVFKPEVRVSSVKFCPTGRSWSATTTEGLLMYSCDVQFMFDPLGADENVTPASIKNVLLNEQYDNALMMALRLNVDQNIREVVESVPGTHTEAVCQSLSLEYVALLLRFLAEEKVIPALNQIEKNLIKKQEDLLSLSNHNKYFLQYLLKAGNLLTSEPPEFLSIKDEPESGDESMSEDDDYSDLENSMSVM